MNKIEEKFSHLNKNKQKALIVFITAGDPDLETTKKLVLALEASGADLIELGVPFSDPLADGPTIQRSASRALKKGVSLKKILEMVKELRQSTKIPLILMSSYNPVFRYGEALVSDAKESGVDGLIIPDLIPEESKELQLKTKKADLSLIYLLAPTSPLERIKTIGKLSRGFVYYISLTGITGAGQTLPADLKEKILQIKENTAKPVAVGFGISNSLQAGLIAEVADGIIIGSALVKIIEDNLAHPDLIISQAADFVKEIKAAIG